MNLCEDHPDIKRLETYGYLVIPKEKFLCSWCGKEIYEGEVYIEYENEAVCQNCIEESKHFA